MGGGEEPEGVVLASKTIFGYMVIRLLFRLQKSIEAKGINVW